MKHVALFEKIMQGGQNGSSTFFFICYTIVLKIAFDIGQAILQLLKYSAGTTMNVFQA